MVKIGVMLGKLSQN